jgi:hypothetical protein
MDAEVFMGIATREGVRRIVAGRASGSRIPKKFQQLFEFGL